MQTAKLVIGFLSIASPDAWIDYVSALKRGLEQAGFIDGKNVAIEYRWARGDYSRLPALASELVSRQVSVLATYGGARSALAAKAATSSIPIVFMFGDGDPITYGLFATRRGADQRDPSKPTELTCELRTIAPARRAAGGRSNNFGVTVFGRVCDGLGCRGAGPSASSQGEKRAASRDQPGQPSTYDGTGDGHAVEHKGRIKRSRTNDVSADPQPIRVQELISRPALKIAEEGRSRRDNWPRC